MDKTLQVKTAGRILDIFELFEAIGKPTTLSELAEIIGAPISSCHALVRTLRGRGYLYSVGARNTFYPTKRLLEIASTIAANDPILEQLEPFLVALRDETQETVILGKRQDDQIIYIDVIEGFHTIRYAAKPGRIIPLHSSAIGKSMLGSLGAAELDAFLKRGRLEGMTDKTLTDKNAVLGDIAAGREQGYFVTRGENVADVMGIARAVKTGAGWLGIAIAGPVPRMEANLGRYAASLLETCEQIQKNENL